MTKLATILFALAVAIAVIALAAGEFSRGTGRDERRGSAQPEQLPDTAGGAVQLFPAPQASRDRFLPGTKNFVVDRGQELSHILDDIQGHLGLPVLKATAAAATKPATAPSDPNAQRP